MHPKLLAMLIKNLNIWNEIIIKSFIDFMIIISPDEQRNEKSSCWLLHSGINWEIVGAVDKIKFEYMKIWLINIPWENGIRNIWRE